MSSAMPTMCAVMFVFVLFSFSMFPDIIDGRTFHQRTSVNKKIGQPNCAIPRVSIGAHHMLCACVCVRAQSFNASNFNAVLVP